MIRIIISALLVVFAFVTFLFAVYNLYVGSNLDSCYPYWKEESMKPDCYYPNPSQNKVMCMDQEKLNDVHRMSQFCNGVYFKGEVEAGISILLVVGAGLVPFIKLNKDPLRIR